MDAVGGLDQMPFEPPNVAGWGYGTKWLSAGSAMVRAAAVQWNEAVNTIESAPDVVGAALDRCSLFDVSARTRSSIQSAVDKLGSSDTWARAWLALGLAATSPEMELA